MKKRNSTIRYTPLSPIQTDTQLKYNLVVCSWQSVCMSSTSLCVYMCVSYKLRVHMYVFWWTVLTLATHPRITTLQIKQYHLQEEREEEVFEEYLKRTSDYQHLKTSKLRRDREIDASKARTLLMGWARQTHSVPYLCMQCSVHNTHCTFVTSLIGIASTVQR